MLSMTQNVDAAYVRIANKMVLESDRNSPKSPTHPKNKTRLRQPSVEP